MGVLIVDQEEISRWAFRSLLGDQTWVKRCLAAESAPEALELLARYDAHVAVVSTSVDGGALNVCRELLTKVPSLRVVILDTHDDMPPTAARAAGAVGIISRSWPVARLALCIRQAGNGVDLLLSSQDESRVLSEREVDVIRLLASGATNREIALCLFLSPHTVKQYTVRLYRKLEARNRVEAVRRAQLRGILQ